MFVANGSSFDDEDIGRLVHALETALNPTIHQSTRTAALGVCEQYKNNERCAEIGFRLVGPSFHSSSVRFFGWQLIKHRVRLHWTELCDEEKGAIKMHLLKFIAACPAAEPHYIKSLIGSILAELAKHVWPQCWPTMLEEVFPLCSSSHSATEIVQSMLQALVEDVVLFQTVSVRSRARDLRQALTVAAADIIQFLNDTLVKLTANQQPDVDEHLVTSTLCTMSAFAEWVDIKLIFKETNGMIYTMLGLVERENVQGAIMNCLITIGQRKGQVSEREVIARMADDCFIQAIALLIEKAAASPGCETSFQFLRRVAILMSSIAGHVLWLWMEQGDSVDANKRSYLAAREKFLKVLFFLASFESRVVAHPVILSWANFLRRKETRIDVILVEAVPDLVYLVSKHLRKDFTANGMLPLEELEFNDDDEIVIFLKSFRSVCVELLRFCTCTRPVEVVRLCFETVFAEISQPQMESGTVHAKWEGLLTHLETVLGSVVPAAEEQGQIQALPVQEAEQLLHLFLTKTSNDATLLKLYISSACCLLNLVALSATAKAQFKLLFYRIFALFDETAQQFGDAKVSALRRQLGASIIRVSKNYTAICLTLMDDLKSLILERIGESSNVLSPFEKVTMFESLILISNQWKNFTSQSQLIGDIMSTTNSIVKSPSFASCFESPQRFASLIGLCGSPTEANSNSADFRSGIAFCISLTLGVLNRCQIPSEENDLRNGGFYVAGNVAHPCTEHVCSAIDHVMSLIRQFSMMWSSDVRPLVSEENAPALNMRHNEKLTLLTVNAEKGSAEENIKQSWERIQAFLNHNLDNAYQVVGLATKVLGDRFYAVPALKEVVVDRVLCSLGFLPEFRLKMLMRHFLLLFLKNCPAERIDDIAGPILSTFTTSIMSRIQPLWQAYAVQEAERIKVTQNGNSDDGMSEQEDRPEDEMVQDQLLRMVTRDYMELLVMLCVNKNPPTAKSIQSENRESGANAVSILGPGISQLAAFGVAVLSNAVFENVLASALVAMSWHDTTSCHKATQLLWPLLKSLINDHESVFNEIIVKFVFEAILRGLNRHGQHDGCEAQLSSLALLVIGGLHKQHGQAFIEVFAAALPHIERTKILDFIAGFDKATDRRRKVLFKTLVSGIIDRHIGQQFKEQQKMDILGPFRIKKQNAKKKVPDEISCDGIARMFAPNRGAE